jgi:hypothetical protein
VTVDIGSRQRQDGLGQHEAVADLVGVSRRASGTGGGGGVSRPMEVVFVPSALPLPDRIYSS